MNFTEQFFTSFQHPTNTCGNIQQRILSELDQNVIKHGQHSSHVSHYTGWVWR